MYLYTCINECNKQQRCDVTKVDEEEGVWCDFKLTENDRLLIGCIIIQFT